jgi:uncharacterized protein
MSFRTKYLLEMIKRIKKHVYTCLILLVVTSSLYGFKIPPSTNRLVNDYANMLSQNEELRLERKLKNYNDTTSTQIVVVTLSDLGGQDIEMVATEIGHKWGVGQKGSDNGIVLLIKPKTRTEKGQAFIATGYGIEGLIPDATAKLIVEEELIPNFKKEQYFKGIDEATHVMMQLCSGEFSAKEYNKKHNRFSFLKILIPILFFFLIFGGVFGRTKRTQQGAIGRSLPFWILLSMMGSGSRHGGSFGNFSSGGGGFGGFGGGGFGGGGAGGSW